MKYTVGSVLGGALSDRVGRRVVLVGAALGSALTLLFMAASTPTTLWIAGAAFGLVLGTTVTVRSAAWADAFAGPRLGHDIGLVAPGYLVGAAVATWGGAWWLEHGGGFAGLYGAGALAALVWAVLGGTLTRVPRSAGILRESEIHRSAPG